MLLTFWYDEAERFLLKLGTSDESIAGIEVYKKLAESAWDDVAGLKHLVGSAAEAIGFHNIQWSSLDPNERSRILPAGKPPVVGFSTEPHLAFLALVDTLQDWDRHHFVPSRGQYRPATRACDMLLQGTGNLIRVSIKDEPNPAEKVTRLFQGWLDVEKLFAGQAKYTFPDRILSTSKATIADESSSAALRERLEGTLRNAIEAARRQLISARPDSVVNAAAGLESAQRRIREGSLSLTKSDLEPERSPQMRADFS